MFMYMDALCCTHAQSKAMIIIWTFCISDYRWYEKEE